MKKYTVGYAPFREQPYPGRKMMSIPTNKIVEATGNQQYSPYGGELILWTEVIYAGRTGWTYAGYFDDYHELYPPEVSIPAATPSQDDGAQYLIYDGRTKYNMCGELCVAYIVGDDTTSLLDKWAAESPSYYGRIYKDYLDRGTGFGDLKNLLEIYDYQDIERLDYALKDDIIGRAIMTPGRMANLIHDNHVIVGVKISNRTGKLQKYGVLHWIVFNSIVMNEMGGVVEIYNPFPNKKEIYSWDEFKTSVGSPYGLVVPSKKAGG